MRAMTSSAPAMGGIAWADTNDTASIERSPVPDNASIRRTRASTGTAASFCNPSRGPTSRTSTCAGQLVMATRYASGACRPGPQPTRRTGAPFMAAFHVVASDSLLEPSGVSATWIQQFW